MNLLLRPFFHWCVEKKINLQVKWVPSKEMLADKLSRWDFDKGDYTLHQDIFNLVQKKFANHITLQTDMFASPGNKKLKDFVSRWPHWQSKRVDALNCPLQGLGGLYANPPWSVIANWTQRLLQFPELQCLMVVPYWVSAIWWPQLIKLQVPKTPCLLIAPGWGMFQNCHGDWMPPPKWPLICMLCSGKCYNPKRSKVKLLKISCPIAPL